MVVTFLDEVWWCVVIAVVVVVVVVVEVVVLWWSGCGCVEGCCTVNRRGDETQQYKRPLRKRVVARWLGNRHCPGRNWTVHVWDGGIFFEFLALLLSRRDQRSMLGTKIDFLSLSTSGFHNWVGPERDVGAML